MYIYFGENGLKVNMFVFYGIFVALLLNVQIKAMSLNGPALTRYDPCGLGVVYFDKVTDILWKGTVNLGLYPHLVYAQIKINFKEPTIFYGVSQQSKIVVNNSWRDLTFSPIGKLPSHYYMYFSINSTNAVEKPTVTKFTLNNIKLCDESMKNNSRVETSLLSNGSDHVCGRRSIDHTELVSVRTASKAGDWPWHAAILIRDPIRRGIAQYQCGGNIISQTTILTAGHCMFLGNKTIETKRLVVEAGISNLWNLNETGRQALAVDKVIIHPSYTLEHATSDLAIIIVNKFVFTKYVQPICIWGPIYDKTSLFLQQAVVTGFGITEQNVLSDTLRSTYTIIQRDETCIALSPKLYSSLLNEFTICVGEGPSSGTGPLNGDSGGGLVVATMHIDNKITWYLRGVLSKCVIPYGRKICDPKYYVIYTDIAPHYGWIYHHATINS